MGGSGAVNSRKVSRICVHTTGLPGGEPFLLLSSLLADWRSWNDVAGRLPSGVYAITMDLRGHGTSSPSAGDYSLAELAADVLNVMDNLAFARVHLVGTSVGRSEEHTSELQSLMRISYAVSCLKPNNTRTDYKST